MDLVPKRAFCRSGRRAEARRRTRAERARNPISLRSGPGQDRGPEYCSPGIGARSCPGQLRSHGKPRRGLCWISSRTDCRYPFLSVYSVNALSYIIFFVSRRETFPRKGFKASDGAPSFVARFYTPASAQLGRRIEISHARANSPMHRTARASLCPLYSRYGLARDRASESKSPMRANSRW